MRQRARTSRGPTLRDQLTDEPKARGRIGTRDCTDDAPCSRTARSSARAPATARLGPRDLDAAAPSRAATAPPAQPRKPSAAAVMRSSGPSLRRNRRRSRQCDLVSVTSRHPHRLSSRAVRPCEPSISERGGAHRSGVRVRSSRAGTRRAARATKGWSSLSPALWRFRDVACRSPGASQGALPAKHCWAAWAASSRSGRCLRLFSATPATFVEGVSLRASASPVVPWTYFSCVLLGPKPVGKGTRLEGLLSGSYPGVVSAAL